MNRIVFLILVVVSIAWISCKKIPSDLGHLSSHYNHSPVKNVYTPLEALVFAYEMAQGIDSYVGHIKNDSIKFSFDFGWHANSGIPSKKELKYRIISNKASGLDECGFRENSDRELLNDLQVVWVNEPDTLISRPTVDVIYHDTYCVLDRVFWGSDLVYHEEYEFEELDTLGFYTKIYFPEIGSANNKIGLFIGPELSLSVTMSNQLGIYSYDYAHNNKSIMLQYLRAARDAFLAENTLNNPK